MTGKNDNITVLINEVRIFTIGLEHTSQLIKQVSSNRQDDLGGLSVLECCILLKLRTALPFHGFLSVSEMVTVYLGFLSEIKLLDSK
jgi:hypothetical protein